MRVVLITKDAALETAAKEGCKPFDVATFADWAPALDACQGADLLFVDLIATLTKPHEVAGYEAFAQAKMAHPKASKVPLVLISPETDYEMDYLVGWDGFVTANITRPVEAKIFRRATTWI